MVDFTRLRRPELEAMAAAGLRFAGVPAAFLAKTGDSVVSELRRGRGRIRRMGAFTLPATSTIPRTQAQVFSTTPPRPAERSAGEQGHFHTFLRPRGIAAGHAGR